ncbi:MAG: flagellar export chaperone FliS [Burkholderiaceae bacterium]
MFARPRADGSSAAGLYHTVQVDTGVAAATPHQLVTMLFEGFLAACSQARGAIQAANVAAKGRAIGRAARIVEEGLRAGLNLRDGGRLAADLNDLYAYIAARLTHANLHNDDAAIEECQRLVRPLLEAWSAIAPQTEPAPAH